MTDRTKEVVEDWLQREKLVSGLSFYAIEDIFPVNKGHSLIIAYDDRETMFDLYKEEWDELYRMIRQLKEVLDVKYNPDGYNIGVNCGRDAGQTIMRFHLHVIPRYNGDVENPKGGVRNFKEALVPYL